MEGKLRGREGKQEMEEEDEADGYGGSEVEMEMDECGIGIMLNRGVNDSSWWW